MHSGSDSPAARLRAIEEHAAQARRNASRRRQAAQQYAAVAAAAHAAARDAQQWAYDAKQHLTGQSGATRRLRRV